MAPGKINKKRFINVPRHLSVICLETGPNSRHSNLSFIENGNELDGSDLIGYTVLSLKALQNISPEKHFLIAKEVPEAMSRSSFSKQFLILFCFRFILAHLS